MKRILKELKNQKKIVFVLSNSNYSFIYLTMVLAFGFGWKKMFDFVITSARKPNFFTEKLNLI